MNSDLRWNDAVLMSMMCQHCINTNRYVDAALMQRWLRCTKPTALAVLNELTIRGFIIRYEKQWRPNAKKYYYKPTKGVFDKYYRKEYQNAYKEWYFNIDK